MKNTSTKNNDTLTSEDQEVKNRADVLFESMFEGVPDLDPEPDVVVQRLALIIDVCAGRLLSMCCREGGFIMTPELLIIHPAEDFNRLRPMLLNLNRLRSILAARGLDINGCKDE